MPEDVRFCPKCGSPVEHAKEETVIAAQEIIQPEQVQQNIYAVKPGGTQPAVQKEVKEKSKVFGIISICAAGGAWIGVIMTMILTGMEKHATSGVLSSFVSFAFSAMPTLVMAATIFGVLAIVKCNSEKRRGSDSNIGKVLGIFGLITGGLGIVMVAIAFVALLVFFGAIVGIFG